MKRKPIQPRVTANVVSLALRRWWVVALSLGLACVLVVGLFLITAQVGRQASPRIRTVAGTGVRAVSADGALAVQSELSHVLGIVADNSDGLYFIDGNRVRKTDPDGTLHSIAGGFDAGYSGDGGPANSARLDSPQGLAMDSEGALYVADLLNHRVRKIGPDGIISTVAGTGEPGFTGDGGPAISARLSAPAGIAVGFGRTVYIADTGNHRVEGLIAAG